MEYTIKRTGRKTLAISIVSGEIIVRAPFHVPLAVIETFIKEKESWIKEKVSLYKPVGVDLSKKTLRYYGKEITLQLFHASKFQVEINDVIAVYFPRNTQKETLEKKIEDRFKENLERYIDIKVSHYAKLLNIEKPPFKIRRYKRIHGRCSSRGELAFNLYLFHESFDFIDYVVLHECAHLIEFNHSSKFYELIEAHMPNYKEIIRLNKFGLNQDLD